MPSALAECRRHSLPKLRFGDAESVRSSGSSPLACRGESHVAAWTKDLSLHGIYAERYPVEGHFDIRMCAAFGKESRDAESVYSSPRFETEGNHARAYRRRHERIRVLVSFADDDIYVPLSGRAAAQTKAFSSPLVMLTKIAKRNAYFCNELAIMPRSPYLSVSN